MKSLGLPIANLQVNTFKSLDNSGDILISNQFLQVKLNTNLLSRFVKYDLISTIYYFLKFIF